MKNYIVYLHRNKINNKVYIGQTYKSLEERARGGHGYQGCPYFYHAIQEYGWDNFEHFILEKNLTSIEADEREKYWIKNFDSTNPEKGYNIRVGGKNCETQYNFNAKKKRVMCCETKEIFDSVVSAAIWAGLQPGSACNISAQIQGKKTSAGKHPVTNTSLHWQYVDDVEKNVQAKELKRPNAKKVKNLDTGEVFLSINEAARAYQITNITISKSCKSNGVIPTGKNSKEKWHWIFVNDN